MSDRRTIVIRLAETVHNSTSLHVTATLYAPHRGARGVKDVPLKSKTFTLDRQYSDHLTPALMEELCTALTLVARNWYETDALPFG